MPIPRLLAWLLAGALSLGAAPALAVDPPDAANLEEIRRIYATHEDAAIDTSLEAMHVVRARVTDDASVEVQDRKSTRLNSSHVKISYAVFCLKKKKKHKQKIKRHRHK